ncbi:putative ricin-type beta-trefoil [Lyophyllum shimeji]|uniref:Ricin-type beta-trefoil n=1 Tax=Lyophyllum shimeji TaxID=47721 RepID=A0A9P3PXD4_LYOSH|nr:putative ricin-type beta-trefoil [Lyophyllum shimeji]
MSVRLRMCEFIALPTVHTGAYLAGSHVPKLLAGEFIYIFSQNLTGYVEAAPFDIQVGRRRYSKMTVPNIEFEFPDSPHGVSKTVMAGQNSRARSWTCSFLILIPRLVALAVGIQAASAALVPPFIGALTLEPGIAIGKCMTAASNADGAFVTLETCTSGPVHPNNSNANQQWGYTGDNRIGWMNKGKCVDLTDGSTANGNRIQSWACTDRNKNQIWNTGYDVNNLPVKSQDTQTGTNQCGTTSSQTSNCQVAWLNSADDFCLWAPPSPDSNDR